ncbi:helix-turn-helix domain-containing protein [Algibacter mikhailovii]|uniref:helix-turn-helix domain-containing protein n=1 Tax=Algibacter mikhailovii TaxID=425498 RepID=UPI0024953633|nr:helix-turn-helix domain-containing protein [Algibacter mikhailovii]
MTSIINFFLIAGVIQGFGFNLVTTFVKKKCDRVIIFLNLTVLFISLNNLQRWLIDNGYVSDLFVIQQLLVPWYVFILPMFYAFVTHFVQVQNKVRDFLKFSILVFVIEMLVRFALIAFVYFNVPDRNTSIIENYTIFEEIFNLVFSIFLFVKACLLIFKRDHLITYILSYDDLNWIKWFIRMGVMVIGFWAIAVGVKMLTGNNDAYKFLNLSSSIVLYWMGYQGFYKYNVLRDRIVLRSSIQTDKVLIGSQNLEGRFHAEDDFFNDKHQQDFDKVRAHIIQAKLYLDPLLSMEVLAADFGMSKSYLSKLINSYSDYNFSDFINALRVEQAKKFLSNSDFKDYTIVAIGLECGFNSKSTFYAAFKKFTSETPSAYRGKY